MIVLHVDTAETWRGGQAQVFHLIDHLSERGVENHLLTPSESELTERLEGAGVDVTIHHHPLRGEWDLGAAWRLSGVCVTEEVDVIHAHDSHGHGVCWLGSCFFTYPPLVVTRRLERDVAQNWFSLRKYRSVDHFIAISGAVRDALVDCGMSPRRVTVIPSGVDFDEIRSADPDPSLLKSLGLDPDRPVMGNVGALTRQKDQKTFVRAAARVLEEVPDAQFVIAGEGVLREDLERRIRDLNVGENVVLAGFVERIIPLIKTIDLFVLTSVFEGLCSTLLQVMASRVPIVATEVGGVPELIEHEHTGLLTPPGEPRNTAAAIKRFLDGDDPFEEWVENAYERAKAYDYPALAEDTEAVYESLVDGADR